ncbi:hypothetical protein BS50DRAFT_247295 [Corynespora cassiicola Philippines]|uniref:Uncharacterized protein n=1 Tax=Corynespora cassiicola Philippines TaxID=1448308 RepID=A0A2T2P3L5_CORCC|nr:hypothetical protein BS50DRAFT_247295 [Corynespora cassiicola Philippines]
MTYARPRAHPHKSPSVQTAQMVSYPHPTSPLPHTHLFFPDLAGTGGSGLSLPTSNNLFWSSPVHQGWDSPVVRTRQVINSADQTGDYELCGIPNHYQYYTAVPVLEGRRNETVDKGTQVDMDLLDSEAVCGDEDVKVEDSLTDFEGEIVGEGEGKESVVSLTPTAADTENAPLSYAIASETKNTELDCEPKDNNLVSDDQNINSNSEAGSLRRSRRVEERKLQAENIDAESYVEPEDNATVSNDQDTNPAPETEPLRRSGRVEARKLQTENTDVDFDFDVNPEDNDIVSNDEDVNSTADARSLRRNKRAEVRRLQAAALSARLQTATSTATATASSAAEGSRRSTRNQTGDQKEQVQTASSAAEGPKRSTRSQAAAQRELEEKERMESNVGLRTRSHRHAGLCWMSS